MVQIELLGTPQTKLRPRFSRWKGKVRTYDPQSEEKKTIRWLMVSKMKSRPPKQGALFVSMEFIFVKPKSAKREHHTVKPDVDNCVKAVLDNGNGILWEDDRQIIQIKATKCYGNEAKTVIRIRGVDE